MQYEAILKIDERIHVHEVKLNVLREPASEDATPVEKTAISHEKDKEEAIIIELKELKREMLEN